MSVDTVGFHIESSTIRAGKSPSTRIFRPGDSFQMGRIDATPVRTGWPSGACQGVAEVVEDKTFWYWAYMGFVDEPMSPLSATGSYAEVSIASNGVSCPQPAVTSLINLGPEPLFRRPSRCSHGPEHTTLLDWTT